MEHQNSHASVLVQWFSVGILVLRLRQEDYHELQASLTYRERLLSQKNQYTNKHEL